VLSLLSYLESPKLCCHAGIDPISANLEMGAVSSKKLSSSSAKPFEQIELLDAVD
jgi:hypothetical protein